MLKYNISILILFAHLRSSLNVRDQVSHPYRTTGKISRELEMKKRARVVLLQSYFLPLSKKSQQKAKRRKPTELVTEFLTSRNSNAMSDFLPLPWKRSWYEQRLAGTSDFPCSRNAYGSARHANGDCNFHCRFPRLWSQRRKAGGGALSEAEALVCRSLIAF
jgi:hypothetical protein